MVEAGNQENKQLLLTARGFSPFPEGVWCQTRDVCSPTGLYHHWAGSPEPLPTS